MASAGLASAVPAVIARDAQLKAIRVAYDRARCGRLCVDRRTCDPGIGKTHLLSARPAAPSGGLSRWQARLQAIDLFRLAVHTGDVDSRLARAGI